MPLPTDQPILPWGKPWRRLAWGAAALVGLATQGSAAAAAAEPYLVIAETDDAPALTLPSVTAGFDSFDDVSAAFQDDRKKVAALEKRLAELEQKAAERIESIPAPDPRPAGMDAGAKDPKKDAKKDEKKPEEPYEVGSDLGMTVKWNHGLQADSAHKDFRVKVGGRIQMDNTAFSRDDNVAQAPSDGGLNQQLKNATDFRRARLRVDGRMYELYDFVGEYDFSNQLNANAQAQPSEAVLGNYAAITENWLQIREVPGVGIIRAGNQKDPFGFEHMTSSRWLNFMERSYAQDLYEGPFTNGFIPGVRLLNTSDDQRATWSVGAFKNSQNVFGFANTSSANMAVGRLTWLPWYEDEGKKLLHLGVAGRSMQTNNDQVRFRARGDLRNGPPGPLNSIYIDSGLLNAPWENQLGLELVGNNGPWSFQSEYFGCWLYNTTSNKGAFTGSPSTNPNYGTAGLQPFGTPVGTYFTNSGYAEVLYFVTGESRAYDRLEARFDRPIPRNNFYVVRDPTGRLRSSEGAVQVGARYQYACLSDSQIKGGTLNALTFGVNWMFNPNSRLYFNYDFAYRDFTNNFNNNASGWITGFGTRLAFDF
ncbi:MAG: porin [Planctomycetota bacterium]|nr:porin [Planctomycetota bacterium]